MITCKIIISENVNGICINMEPDDRDANKTEQTIAAILDRAIKIAMSHVMECTKANKIYNGIEIDEKIKIELKEKWPEII